MALLSVFGAIGLGLIGWLVIWPLVKTSLGDSFIPWGMAISLGGAFAGTILLPLIINQIVRRIAKAFQELPTSALVASTTGLLVGLVIATLVSIPLFRLPGWYSWGIPLIISGAFGLLGLWMGAYRERDVRGVLPASALSTGRAITNGKVLVDTSAIIDGRIADLGQTGFLQGTLLIPRFVLDELRHIADSNDPLRRSRGRRGLEVLASLRKESGLNIQILDADLRNGDEVDSSLVRLGKELKAPIFTTDFNLNRVAELQGVKVLNVNQLAHALKPVVLPGEELRISIVQEGKEYAQGVGYLDDGTMIVVEGGRRYLGTIQEVIVVRVLQTAVGRIIFAQPKGA